MLYVLGEFEGIIPFKPPNGVVEMLGLNNDWVVKRKMAVPVFFNMKSVFGFIEA